MYMMGGISLLERTIRLAARCPRLDRTLVSTDSPDMHALAERFGVASPALRPAHLASSSARSADVVADLVESAGIPAGWIILLQVTTPLRRSEEHTSELQSLMRISYAVFCLKKKKKNHT